MDPASGILMSGIDSNPGSSKATFIDSNPGSSHGSSIDSNPGSASQAIPNGLVMQALASTRAALSRPGEDAWFKVTRSGHPNLLQLEAEWLVPVVQTQIGQRLMVIDRTLWLTGTPAPAGAMPSPALKLLTLDGPSQSANGLAILKKQTLAAINRAEERPDRVAEIQVQANNLWPFFSAITYVVPSRAPLTAALMAVVTAVVSAIAQQFKHQVACPRPVDCSASVQPIITTPSHASLPSGHAAGAYAMQAVLQALLGRTEDDGMPVAMRRLARRIADNRVVAGLHFPMDGCAGWLLARTMIQVVQSLVASTPLELNLRFSADDPKFVSDDPTAGELPPGDKTFSLSEVPGCTGDNTTATPVGVADLATLWTAAKSELVALGLARGSS